MSKSVIIEGVRSPIGLKNGKLFKNFRGMGSVGAMNKGSADRYFQIKQKDISKYINHSNMNFSQEMKYDYFNR